MRLFIALTACLLAIAGVMLYLRTQVGVDQIYNQPAYRAETKSPRTTQDPTLASRIPGMFPKSATEAEISKELRAHLRGITIKAPHEPVVAEIEFREQISPDQLLSIATQYGFTVGTSTYVKAVEFIHHPPELSARGLEAGSSTRMIEVAAVWGTPVTLMAAWDSWHLLIKYVSILGQR